VKSGLLQPKIAVPRLRMETVARLCRGVIFFFDRLLQRAYGVFEFDRHPDCILRISVDKAEDDRVLPDGTRLEAGDRVVEIHFWNERLAEIEEARAPGTPWVDCLENGLRLSIGRLTRYLEQNDSQGKVVACRGEISLAHPERFYDRLHGLGLTIIPMPAESRFERFRQKLENLYARVLAGIVHPVRHGPHGRQRMEVWISRQVMRQMYGSGTP
jgi:hypothetical protein